MDGDGDAEAVGPGEGAWICGGNGGKALLLEPPHAVMPSEMTVHKTTKQRFMRTSTRPGFEMSNATDLFPDA
jgi:hypothetical protein